MQNSMPEKLGEAYKYLTTHLKQVSDVPDLEARRILGHHCHVDWSDITAFPEKILNHDVFDDIEADLRQRLSGKPLSKIFGVQQFWGLDFIVSEDVLDPRPDTETIVDIAVRKLKSYPPKTILDLGTGTGCLAISLLCEFENAHAVAVDKSPQALGIARKNAAKHGVLDRLELFQSDWWSHIPDSQTFDLVVSNPPYIRESVIPCLMPEVKNHDPILSLDGGKDGLQAYKKIFSRLFLHLNDGGKVLLEIGFDQAGELTRLSEESGFTVNQVHADLSGQPRVVEISNGDK